MQSKITKTIALASFVLAAATSQAQIKFSKVTNGTRTAVASGSKVEVQLNEDQTVKNNIVVDLDIAAFKKAYNFDRVSITYVLNGSVEGSVRHVFDSQLNLKKYQGKGIVPIYVFDTKNFKETDYRVLLDASQPYRGTWKGKPRTTEILVTGSYTTGEEGYFDSYNNYQVRDLFSKEEPIAKLEYVLMYSKEQVLDYDYDWAMNEVDGIDSGFKRSVTDEIEQYVAPYVATPLYGALSKGFREVYDAKLAAVKAETDKQKAIEAVKVFVEEMNIMYAVAKKDKDVLKAMNKEIKSKTTTEEKWALIKANA